MNYGELSINQSAAGARKPNRLSVPKSKYKGDKKNKGGEKS